MDLKTKSIIITIKVSTFDYFVSFCSFHEIFFSIYVPFSFYAYLQKIVYESKTNPLKDTT